MNCFKCNGKIKVLRTCVIDSDVYRHRKCEKCNYDFYTREYFLDPYFGKKIMNKHLSEKMREKKSTH